MFIFGHLGFGLKIAQPVSEKRFSKAWILVGTLVPDLVDKPIYYGLSWLTGKSGAELGVFAGTRTLGHTGIFLITLIFMTYLLQGRRARIFLESLCIGVSTHLLLDNLGDALQLFHVGSDTSQNLRVVAWPLFGLQFPVYPFHGVKSHLSLLKEPYFLMTETFGGLILIWEGRKLLRHSLLKSG